MTMGLICCDFAVAQSRIGDKNAVRCILDFSFEGQTMNSSILVKWGLWSLLVSSINVYLYSLEIYINLLVIIASDAKSPSKQI